MRCGLLVTVFEALGRDGRPKFNGHVIVVMPDADARDRLIESLHRSSVYVGRVDARPVDNWNGLTAYLLKEATPAAWFAAGKRFRRIRGSIPLGDLGGDRVVLSRDLRDALIASGRIAPFKRTYAKRQQSPPRGAVSHRCVRSPMADRPPLGPTPRPATMRMIRGRRSEQRPEAFLRRRAELVAEPEGQLVDAGGAVHGDGSSPRQSVHPRWVTHGCTANNAGGAGVSTVKPRQRPHWQRYDRAGAEIEAINERLNEVAEAVTWRRGPNPTLAEKEPLRAPQSIPPVASSRARSGSRPTRPMPRSARRNRNG
jgi:hypothetical protein